MKNLFSLEYKKNNLIYYYLPILLLSLWIFFSFISIFFVGTSNLFDGFVVFSIIIRILITLCGLYFFNNIYIKQRKDKKFYNFFKAFVGYGVVFTYVFYSLPRMVGEFNGNISKEFALFNFVFILILSLFPSLLYILLRSNETRLILGIFNQKEIDHEKKVKKDKVLKKKEITKIKSERSTLENLWYNWIDVIVQAIIIALIIQQFLFQMYQIPSESMVPTFLINDRVVVNKAIYGPHIPLTEWKLPSPIKPKIGDIVVFINPEADDPNSEIRYKNVFVRIFHPFIYMLTLSMVDIDRKSTGEQKQRFIVKRLIANEGEKICLLNDKVYKKTKDTNWTQMDKINGQKEYGQVDLYYDLNPKMQTQFINKVLRQITDESIAEIDKETFDSLKNNLVNEKQIFIQKINSLNKTNFIKFEEEELTKNENNLSKFAIKNIEINDFFNNNGRYIFNLNRKEANNIDKNKLEEAFISNLLKYHYCIYYNSINNLSNLINKSGTSEDYFNKQINSNIVIKENMNPYTEYMKKINAYYKIYQLKLYSKIINDFQNGSIKNKLENFDNLEKDSFYQDLHKFYLISIYIDGLPIPGFFDNNFTFRNFPEYPSGNNEYLKNNEYFLLGDNRYNSLDMRFKENFSSKNYIDEDDKTDFSKFIVNDWGGRTINLKHILGKAVAIYYPLNRAKMLK